MKLSIVTTMYYSAPFVKEFYNRISLIATKITREYEIIFVDDCSPDSSLYEALKLFELDKKVKILQLSKNFGHHKAIMTGLLKAKGDYVFLIDLDLEEPPEILLNFWDAMNKNDDADVIYGLQKNRKGSTFEKITGHIFWSLILKLSDLNIVRNQITSRLMKKNYVNSLCLYKERELFFGGISENVGFKQIGVYVEKQSKGSSTYSLKKKTSQVINAITSFSTTPLKLIFIFGALVSLLSLLFICYHLSLKFIFSKQYDEGWPSVILSIWLIGGLNFMFLGTIGIYISKIFIEVKKRPYSIIKKTYEK